MASSSIMIKTESEYTKINLRNGTFVFSEDPGLMDYNKNDFLTYQLAFDFDENASAPIFETYLNRVLPDKSSQNVLAEYIGYVFMKEHKYNKCLLLYGSGANGKSVFFEIVNAIFGRENMTYYSLRELANDNCKAQLENKLLNYSTEIDATINKEVFKQLTSGEPINGRLLYKDYLSLIHI